MSSIIREPEQKTLVCFAPAAAALLTSSGCSDPQGMEHSPLFSSEVCRGDGGLQRQTQTQIFIEGVGESEIGARQVKVKKKGVRHDGRREEAARVVW